MSERLNDNSDVNVNNDDIKIIEKKPKFDLYLKEITDVTFINNCKLHNVEGGEFYYCDDFLDKSLADELYKEALELDCL